MRLTFKLFCLCSIVMLLNMKVVVGGSYEYQSLEKWIQASDLIVQGKITNVEKIKKNGEILNKCELLVADVIKNNTNNKSRNIIIESLEGAITNDDLVYHYYFRPNLLQGSNAVFILFEKNNGNFEIAGAFRGFFQVIDNQIKGTNISVNDFISKIKIVSNTQNKVFNENNLPRMEQQIVSPMIKVYSKMK